MTEEKQTMLCVQRTIDFENVPTKEVEHVQERTSEPPPAAYQGGEQTAPFVRPERQLTYGGVPHYEWPAPDSLHDRHTITVDRLTADSDGPAHRFVIKRGDRVEVYLSRDKFHVGQVIGVSHAQEKVRVAWDDTLNKGGWFHVGRIYPPARAHERQPKNAVPLSEVVATVNGQHGTNFTEEDRVADLIPEPPPLPYQGKDREPLAVRPQRQLTYGGTSHEEWPHPRYLRDHDTITVDRLQADIDGPPHRFLIQSGDVVEVFFAPGQMEVGEVLAVHHERRQVRVRYPWSEGQWVDVEHVHPSLAAPPESFRHEQLGSSSQRDALPSQEPQLSGQDQEPKRTPYTFEDFKKFYATFASGAVPFATYQEDFQRLWDSQQALQAELVSRYNARQLAALASGFGSCHAKRSTKEQNAAQIVQKMLAYFVLDGTVSYSPFSGETYELAVKKKVEALDAGEYYRHFEIEQEKSLAKEQALADPRNLADFRTFIDAKGEDALTDEQFARYDAMRTEMQREVRASQQAKNTVAQFQNEELQSLAFVRKEGYHDKRQCPLYIVQLESRVERVAFHELNRKAKQLGGWYSSFKKCDAGFQFLDQSQADRFCELLTGSVDRSDVLEARKARKELSAAESLHELATNLMDRAEETIARSNESLQNTARRADIQAGVRGRAYADQALSRTMHSLAEALSRGEAKFLDGVRHKTQLETLDTVLRLARWARVRAYQKGEKESSYRQGLRQDRIEHEPLGPADIRFVEFPYPNVYRRNVHEAIGHGLNTRGVKQAAAAVKKHLGATDAD